MKKSSILFLFLIIFSVAITSAQPPFQQSPTDIGINIESAIIEYHKINQYFTFHVHAHNSTDGLILKNDTTNCTIHIFRPSDGEHIIEELMEFTMSDFDFGLNVSAGNFSEIGQYSVLFYCEVPGEIGGFFEYAFYITKTGLPLNKSESIIYLILAFGVFLLFVISFYFMILTPYDNEVNRKGAVIKITKLKYVKLGLILLTWVLFTWFLNILIGLSDNFVSLTMYYGFFGFIFQTMNNLAIPLGLAILVISFFEIIRDVDLYKNIKKLGSALG